MDTTYSSVGQLVVLSFWALFGSVRGQGLCNPGSGDMTGVSPRIAGQEFNSASQGMSYIIEQKGSTNCYGVIAEWQTVINGGCSAADPDMTFDVWRNSNVGILLVGRNSFRIGNCVDLGGVSNAGTMISLRIPENSRIPIESGNFIGWTYANGNALYETSNDAPVGKVLNGSCASINPGHTCNPTAQHNTDFLLQARLVRGPAPTIDNLDNAVHLYENEQVTWTAIFTVRASHPSSQAREGSKVNVDPDSAVLFTFNYDTSQPFNFTSDANKKGVLDVIPMTSYDFESQSAYLLPISVTALLQTASATLTVSILDRNDPHSIDNLDSSTTASVLDTSCQTIPIYKVTYTDEDNPTKFPAKRFYVMSTNPSLPRGAELPFVINRDSGEVFCKAGLQNWTTSMGTSYDLRISVVDGMHSATGTLTVDIQETLDPPYITNLPDTQQIYEDLPSGSAIFRVSANGPNTADIRFSVEYVSPTEYFYYFSLDETTGVITLSPTAALDYFHQSSFNITVGVRDSLQTGNSENLQVELLWVNRKPVFNPKDQYLTICEECYEGPLLGAAPSQCDAPDLRISITDRDVNDSLTCGVLAGFGSQYFEYNCTDLYLVQCMDTDNAPQNGHINLTLWVKDKDGMSNSGAGDIAHVYITVADVNDNWPAFVTTNTTYRSNIPENTPGGVSLFTVTATDNDSGSFGEITYSLLDDNGSPLNATLYFEVDSKSGLVQTKQYLDYEAIQPKDVYFYIQATDGGGLFTRISAVVTIENVNDIRPVWQCHSETLRDFNDQYLPDAECFYNDELRSDITIGYEVLSIVSTDVDSPDSGITYHLLEPNRFFDLNTKTGQIQVANDLGTYVKYILYCYSQDNGNPNLLSQPHLRVRVDTFNPKDQLIDITIEMEKDRFNETNQVLFQEALRDVLLPWFPKIESIKTDENRTIVSIYALKDNSTFDEANLHKVKQFVDRNELLGVLRQDFYGKPSDVLKTPEFDVFDVILVEPTYPIWLIDTFPGIITLGVICLVAVGLILALILGLCSRYEKCCFKKKRQIPEGRWERQTQNKSYDRLSVGSGDDVRTVPRQRTLSVDTVHSLIYPAR